MLPSDIRRTQRISPRWLRALAFRGSSLLVLAAFSVPASAADVPLMSEDARPPTVLEYEIVKSWPHDRAAFTQGLIYRDGFLYESTGLNGRSSLRKVKLETGEVVQRESVASEYFAEGLTDWKDRLIQITWQSQLGFVHDLKTFRREGQFNYSGEGWGITHDARHDRLFVTGKLWPKIFELKLKHTDLLDKAH